MAGASQGQFVVRGPLGGQGAAAERILRDLPQWFAIESALVEYAAAADELPTFVAVAGHHPSGEVVGFVTLKRTSECAQELHVMGVLPAWHRRGVGRALVERAATYARAAGGDLLHVKTLAASDPDPGYAATRAFYRALGFLPLEVLPEVWGPDDPCLLLVKPL